MKGAQKAMLVAPADSPTEWAKLVLESLPIVGSVIAYVLGRAHQKGKDDRRLDDLEEKVEGIDTTVSAHSTTIADHTMLHRGYEQMQKDVRTTRDCVIGIAATLKLRPPEA